MCRSQQNCQNYRSCAKITLTIDFFGYPRDPKIWVLGGFESKLLLQSAPGLRKMIGMACSGYLWCSPRSGGYADIKIIAIRCVDCNKIAKTMDHMQKSLWLLIFWIFQKCPKSEFWVVLRASVCFKVLQSCEKWSKWHVLGIYDVLQGPGVTLI